MSDEISKIRSYAMRRTSILYYGSPPLVYGSAGFYKLISSKGVNPFIKFLRKIFNIEVFSYTDRLNYALTIKQVYLMDFLKITFEIIRKSINKDLLIVLGYPAFFELIVFLIISKLRRIPIIVRETHWYWPLTRISRFLWHIYFKLLRFVDGILCPGLASYKYWKTLGFHNVYIVHFYAMEAAMVECEEKRLKFVKEKYNIPEEGIIILYLGRLIKKKGVDMVIKAFAELINEVTFPRPLYLVIAGAGPEKHALINLCKQLGVADKVLFIGPVAEDEKECIYKLAHVFVYTPIKTEIPEEWPIAPLEVLHLGIPTIVSDIVGSLPEIKKGVIIVREVT